MQPFLTEWEMNKILLLRPALKSDSSVIWRWRNDPITLKMSIQESPINWRTHSTWFDSALNNSNWSIYVGYFEELRQSVGVVRFDGLPTKKKATVSINLNPSFRNKKLSYVLLEKSIANYLEHNKHSLIALIKSENTASAACFTRCGFYFSHKIDGIDHYVLPATPSMEKI